MSGELEDDTACCDECGSINLGHSVDELNECGCPECGSHQLRGYAEWVEDLPDATEGERYE